MNCDECMEKISLYIDQMLSEEEEKAIVAHLDLCETCHKEYQILIGMIGLLKQPEKVDLPKGFHTDLMQRFEQEQKVMPIKAKRFKWGYPAGLVASLLIGFIVLNHSSFIGSKNSAVSEAPMTAYSMPQENAIEMTEGVMEDKMSKAAKASEAPLVTRNEVERAVKEETKSLTGDAYDASIEQVIWEATITDTPTFIKAIEDYLDEQQLTYVEEEGYLLITSEHTYTSLWEWLQTQSEVKQLMVTHNTGSDLKLIYHEQGDTN